MPFPPLNPLDAFDSAQQFLGNDGNNGSGFVTEQLPSPSGFGTRQNRIRNNRPAVNARNLIHWLVPEQPIVQMYCNPQNIQYQHRKAITQTRTKGGYLLQYWGEELTTLRISGTTGTSGIEGINVLYDVYRNEQLAIDPYALFLAAQQDQTSLEGLGSDLGNAIGGSIGSAIGSVVGSVLQQGANAASPETRSRPSLAQMAFTVEMYWSGKVYRGYFTSFNFTERADNIGMFDYDMEFVATQQRGIRENFFAWHRSATSGPSNSDPILGTPYSYGSLVQGDQPTPRQSSPEDTGIVQQVANSLGFDI